jgi:methionine-rich copper-binding protein CopC
MIRRFTTVLAVLCLAALAVFTVGLSAHLDASRTMPANKSTVTDAPARVQVWFTEPPSPRVSLLEMKGPGGEVALGELEVNREDRSVAAPVRGTLAPGSYEVSWRTAGNDGHVMRGTFTFVLAAAE